jgi:hypothetical protein
MLWFTCTAILDKKIYIKVIKLVGFYWSIIDFKQTDINWLNLFIVRGYIKRRDKNNYKALFFVIKEVFKETAVKEDHVFITFD